VHGVAFAQDLKIGFTTNGKSNSVTVFELDSLKPIGEIAVKGQNPDAILYVPEVGKVYVFNGKTASYDVIDARTRKVVGSGAASGRPESAVSDGRGRVYFNIEDHSGIDVIDTASDKVVAKWTLAGCDEPSGLAIDPVRSRLFSSCQNRIMAVTDSRTGKRVTQFTIGEHPDAAVFDAATRTVLTSGGGGAGTLAIVRQDSANHYTVLQSVQTAKGAKTMAMDDLSKTVYLPTVVGDRFVVLVVERAR
jgi:DNA-binding beta-propeller fold protein YncE